MARSGPIPAGSPSVSATGRGILLAFDHRLAAQFLEIALGPGLGLLAPKLLAGLPRFGRLLLGFLLLAQREQLNALRRRLRSGKVPYLGLVENIAQRRRQLGRVLGDRIANGDVAQRAGKRQPRIAGRQAGAPTRRLAG